MVFKKTRHLSIFWARSVQSVLLSHFFKIYFDIILPSSVNRTEPNKLYWKNAEFIGVTSVYVLIT